MFVDSDHAEDKVLCRPRSGYLIYVNNWFSKKLSTVETSVFGAEFVAMIKGRDALRGLRYKLKITGILISGPSYIHGNNMSVVHNQD